MEMDLQLSPSPPTELRRLKRLKKPNDSIKPPADDDDFLLFSSVDFAKLEAIENGLAVEDDSLLSQEDSLFDTEDQEMRVEIDETNIVVPKTKRVLMFDDDDKDDEGKIGNNDDDGVNVEGADFDLLENKEWKTKNKRTKRNEKCESKAKPSKRETEKERKAYLQELHAESQRVLRESRNVAFEPIRVVQKPISSVLEKIRKRKLEISRKFLVDRSDDYEESFDQGDSIEDEMDEKVEHIDGESSVDAPNVDGGKESPEPTNNENDCDADVLHNEVPANAFREPVNDTQDLFVDSEPNEMFPKENDEQNKNLLEEEVAPSMLSMNLTLDSVPVDDSSSDEEDNDKENVSPHPRIITKSDPSSNHTIAKDFVDDEAEEEDDSDHDGTRFKENEEDEDIDDLEELNDMIATTYKEKHIDREKRNELHQKWLEQQDAAGTDNLMQRLKFGSDVRDTCLLDEEPESEEDGDAFDDEDNEESLPMKSAKMNIKKAKQIILQFASEKEEIYVSDEEEDAHSRHAHHRLLIRKEEQMALASPTDDEKSRQVMGLIKKLNVVPDKKNPKTSTFFDSVLKDGNSNSSSKSSFLGRVSKHPIPLSRKQGSGTYRSFIFGRDDSNSRSSVSVSEESSDVVSQEAKTTKNMSAKYSNSSQAKFNDRNRDAAQETRPGTSLLDIFKRPPSASQVFHQQKPVDLTNCIFSFRAPKKLVKTERRR